MLPEKYIEMRKQCEVRIAQLNELAPCAKRADPPLAVSRIKQHSRFAKP